MIKTVIITTMGFCAGAGAGYFACMKRFEMKYAQIANEEIASVQEMCNSKIEKMMKYYPEAKSKESKHKVKPVDGDGRTKPANDELTRSPIQMNSYERAKQNYNLIRGEQNLEDDPDMDEEDDDQEYTDAAGMTEQDSINASSVVDGDPYLIDSDEYAEENIGFDKAVLYYYRVDDVVCSEDNEDIITEVEETIGYDALCALDTQTSVWVRNERLHIEYEILAVNSAYSDEVGRASSPREKYNKSKRRDDNEE